MSGRHRKLDQYVAGGNPWQEPSGEGVFVDLGCGFPPFTTVETAQRLRDWRVVGVDPAFGRYLVYDADGAYACFDARRHLRYAGGLFVCGSNSAESASSRYDGLLAKLGVCARDPAGYLGSAPKDMPPEDIARCSSVLAGTLDDDGFAEETAEVLRRAGRYAWRNHVGHVAMRPFLPPPLPPSAVL